jgi:hypothetical protein
VNATTGRSVWAVRRCGSPAVGPCDANTAPTYTNGLVLVGDGDGHLYALNASSGATVWRFRGPYVAKGSDGSCKSALYDTPAAADGRAFFGNPHEHARGSELRCSDDLTMFVRTGSNDCQLWAVNITDGTQLWHVPFGGIIDGASPVLSHGPRQLVFSGSDRQNAVSGSALCLGHL